jgi:hypothetical protein
MTPDPFDPDNLRIRDDEIPTRRVELPSVRSRIDRQFLPALPERVFRALVKLPRKAWAVYQVIKLRARLMKCSTVELSGRFLGRFGLTRHDKRNALRHLERAGLVRVERRARKNPTITVLAPPPAMDPPSPADGGT